LRPASGLQPAAIDRQKRERDKVISSQCHCRCQPSCAVAADAAIDTPLTGDSRTVPHPSMRKQTQCKRASRSATLHLAAASSEQRRTRHCSARHASPAQRLRMHQMHSVQPATHLVRRTLSGAVPGTGLQGGASRCNETPDLSLAAFHAVQITPAALSGRRALCVRSGSRPSCVPRSGRSPQEWCRSPQAWRPPHRQGTCPLQTMPRDLGLAASPGVAQSPWWRADHASGCNRQAPVSQSTPLWHAGSGIRSRVEPEDSRQMSKW
jgi:hypothetical protein